MTEQEFDAILEPIVDRMEKWRAEAASAAIEKRDCDLFRAVTNLKRAKTSYKRAWRKAMASGLYA